jgi:putative cell wall-binding protein
MTESPPVFLSYGSPDRQRVLPFYDFLISRGIEAWVDVKELRVGQNWDFEIKRALRRASIIIVFISNTSIDRRGYVQREIKAALDRASEKLIDDIYLIPVILDDDASVPEQLSHIQHVRARV